MIFSPKPPTLLTDHALVIPAILQRIERRRKPQLDHDAIKRKRIMISSLYLRMIFSENRVPLFRIML
jgi:hypothetical protein